MNQVVRGKLNDMVDLCKIRGVGMSGEENTDA